MNRWKAFAIHLLLSILVLGGIMAATVFIWYPPPLFQASGVERFAILLIGVDMVIGPLLTLIVFNPAKRSLRFDLGCIALLQVGALLYGLNVLRETRPVYFVAYEERISMIAANAINAAGRDNALPEFRENPWLWPRLAAVPASPDPVEESRRRIEARDTGLSVEATPRYYEPYGQMRETLLSHARPLSQLSAQGEEQARQVQRFATRHGRDPESLRFVTFEATERDISAILDAETAALIGLLDIHPGSARVAR